MKRLFLFLLLMSRLGWCEENPLFPWFTGTLLDYGGENEPKGKINFQTFIYALNSYGSYNTRGGYSDIKDVSQFVMAYQVEIGILPRLDFTVYSQFTQVASQPGSHLDLGSTQAYFGIQILREKAYTEWPNLRLLVMEIMPTGPSKQDFSTKTSVRAFSHGPFQTGGGLVLDKTFFFNPDHPLDLTFDFLYLFSSDLTVTGVSPHGGDHRTVGTVRPGDYMFFDFAFQYLMLKNWAICSDLAIEYTFKSHFDGSTVVELNTDDVLRFSITPSLEYNPTENAGFLGSLWFTLWGKNTDAFIGGSLSAIVNF